VDTSRLAPTRARPGPVATNERAEEELCLSVYLEQPASSNRSRCWNWFRAAQQEAARRQQTQDQLQPQAQQLAQQTEQLNHESQ